MSVELERYEFSCPFCNEARVTLITKDKLDEIRKREKVIQEIFSPSVFDATYREIFVSRICSKCQIDTFGGSKYDKPFDVDENASRRVLAKLTEDITEMYENNKE